jgi:rhodanese-related sulfurtransferase
MIQEITVRQLKALIESSEKINLIDVRSPLEFAGGHVPGAVNIPLENVEANSIGVTTTEQVVMICQRGSRSMAACKKIAAAYPLLVNVAGGTSAWIDAGFAVLS